MHPLVTGVQDLSDDELLIKINNLNSRLSKAIRFGYNDAVQQLNMILEEYQWEYQRRQEKMFLEMQELAKKTGDLGDYINIG